MPTLALEPLDAHETAAMLADAGRQGLTLVPRGSGTKLGWARNAAASDTYISTTRINAPVQHFAGDLVATIPGGATLESANAILARAGQWLPIDPGFADTATIGGIVATNDSGPRRHKYGAPRDLIIGVEMALSDGRVAKAGGRVVKNVAGYDLSRLVCGSFGTLAVITGATFKLAPLPASSRTVVATCSNVAEAARLALTIASQPVTPSALEIEAPSARLLIRFETTERAADQMAATTRALLLESGASIDVLAGEQESALWQAHESSIWERTGLVAKIAVLPTDVEGCLGMIASAHPRLDWFAVGRAALGVLLVRVNAAADTHSILAGIHQHVAARQGTLLVLRGFANQDAGAMTETDHGLRTVMEAVKAQFDPNGVLPALP